MRLPSTRSWRPPDPYAPTIGAVAAASTTSPVAPLGDPATVAAVVVQVATMADPPRRLLLGSDAVGGGQPLHRPRRRPALPKGQLNPLVAVSHPATASAD